MERITTEELFAAFSDALARVHEWDGADVEWKLGAFGLDADSVRLLLEDRWAVYRQQDHAGEQRHTRFVQGFAEGLITGLQLAQRRAAA